MVQLRLKLGEYSVKWEVCRKISLWSTVWLVSLDLPGALKNKIKSLKAIKAIKAIGYPKVQQIEFCCWKKETYKGLLEGLYKCNCRCPVILRCMMYFNEKDCLTKTGNGKAIILSTRAVFYLSGSVFQLESNATNQQIVDDVQWKQLQRYWWCNSATICDNRGDMSPKHTLYSLK